MENVLNIFHVESISIKFISLFFYWLENASFHMAYECAPFYTTAKIYAMNRIQSDGILKKLKKKKNTNKKNVLWSLAMSHFCCGFISKGFILL